MRRGTEEWMRGSGSSMEHKPTMSGAEEDKDRFANWACRGSESLTEDESVTILNDKGKGVPNRRSGYRRVL
jgi:hypothetical protein